MARCALPLSFQKLGSSACLFSSARRACALSTSKMPPQQPQRPLDLFDGFFGFGAHDGRHLAAAPAIRNGFPKPALGQS
jgi:hypothetical protein